jgi:hypothetical protein
MMSRPPSETRSPSSREILWCAAASAVASNVASYLVVACWRVGTPLTALRGLLGCDDASWRVVATERGLRRGRATYSVAR